MEISGMTNPLLSKSLTCSLVVATIASVPYFSATATVNDVSPYRYVETRPVNKIAHNNYYVDDTESFLVIDYSDSNIQTGYEREAFELFGQMREATPDEVSLINNYIKANAVAAGINFWD